MKIVLIGGHFSPALSVSEELKTEDILYLGRKHALEGDSSLSLEYTTLKSLGINFITINTGRLQRRFTKHTILSIFKIPAGFWQSYKVLKEFKPDVVVGFGSYLSVPVVMASYLLKIPVVLHEQTLEAGFANKFLSRFASKICISFESSAKFFPKEKTILTGNPLRKEIIESKKIKPEKNITPLIYITGGSLGSHKINLLIEKNLKKILEIAFVVHQTGDAKPFNDYDRLTNLKESLEDKLQKRYELYKFIDPKNTGKVLARSDLVVSRSGINTVCELIFLEKPSLFIPLSFSQKQEQRKNAQMAKDFGLAEIFKEDDSAENFLSLLKNMTENLENYKNKSLDIIKEDASRNIVKVIKNAAKIE